MTADIIALIGLRVTGRHGVLASERRDGQDFIVDALLETDTRAAASADDLSLTVDYSVLAGQLAAIVAGEPVALIETLAERLAGACLADGRVQSVRITVHKPQAPVGQPLSDVLVTIRRARSADPAACGGELAPDGRDLAAGGLGPAPRDQHTAPAVGSRDAARRDRDRASSGACGRAAKSTRRK